jgi:hypothetical protein
MMVNVDCDKEIERLKKEKDELVNRFIEKAENINAQIRYLKSLKEKGGAV